MDAVAAAVEITNATTLHSRPLLFDQYLWARKNPDLPSLEAVQPELVSAPETPEFVDYRIDRLTPPSFRPGPSDRFVRGRVMCRSGLLAIVSCSAGVARKGSIGPICDEIANSLDIGGAPEKQSPESAGAVVRAGH